MQTTKEKLPDVPPTAPKSTTSKLNFLSLTLSYFILSKAFHNFFS